MHEILQCLNIWIGFKKDCGFLSSCNARFYDFNPFDFHFLFLWTEISSLRENLWRQRDTNISLASRMAIVNSNLKEQVQEHHNLTKKVTIARSHNETLKTALDSGFKELESVIAESQDAMSSE